MPDRLLFTVRSGAGSFRVVACTARQALVHVQEMVERGLEDVNVTDLNGKRYELADVRLLADAEPTEPAAA